MPICLFHDLRLISNECWSTVEMPCVSISAFGSETRPARQRDDQNATKCPVGFECKMINGEPEDELRRLIIAFYPADGEMAAFEV